MTKGLCYVCGEDDPKVLKEYHHIFGRILGEETILLCHNCHDKITHDQNGLAPKERKQPKCFFLVSIGSLLILIGKELMKYGKNSLKDISRRKEKRKI